MNPFALHLPEQRGFFRWTLAGVAILMAHAAIVTAVALWYVRRPAEPTILPAIAVTLAPVEASSPEIQDQDIAVGPTMQQAEAAPKQPPKEEKPVELVQQPAPPQEAEVTLPKAEPKQVEKPTESRPPAPETRAPPRRITSANSAKRAPTPMTRWCSGICSASSAIRRRRAERPV